MSTEQTTSMSFTDDDLGRIMVALDNEVSRLGESWDAARQLGSDDHSAYWRRQYEHAHRLLRRTETARKRLRRKRNRVAAR